ncbi:MAG: hypothetical protein BWY94_02214 [Actinobacteria bacterium ADurb.BinA094]|nr:MAG: hypothetical protein BWY94_02214 [Actinobacteria bacterium ADurb.BinA094]
MRGRGGALLLGQGAGGGLLGALGGGGLETGDLVLEAAGGALQLRLQRQHLVLALLALCHQLDRRLAVLLEREAAVGDLAAVRPGDTRRPRIALGHTPHHVQLGEQVLEGA